jgi:hypothetical protein
MNLSSTLIACLVTQNSRDTLLATCVDTISSAFASLMLYLESGRRSHNLFRVPHKSTCSADNSNGCLNFGPSLYSSELNMYQLTPRFRDWTKTRRQTKSDLHTREFMQQCHSGQGPG